MGNKIRKTEIKNLRLWKLMTDKGITSPKELAKRLFESGLLVPEIDKIEDTAREKIIDNSRKKITRNLSDPESMDYRDIKNFCEFFDCSADYFLEFLDTPQYDNIKTVHDITGLSENAISALSQMKNAKEKSPAASMYSELSVLDFVLSDCLETMKKTGFSETYSILHYIGLYLHCDYLEKTPINRVRYGSGNKFYDFQTGDCVNGLPVENINIYYDSINRPANDDKIYITDKASSQTYEIDFQKLIQTHAKDDIFLALDRLKKAYNNKNAAS